MICPQCKAEYRQGFTRCADCDVELAATPEAQPGAEAEVYYDDELDEKLRVVWAGIDARMCAEIGEKLKGAEIPFQVIRRQDLLFNTNRYPELQLAVPESMNEKAMELIADPDAPEPIEENTPEMELPDQGEREEVDDRWDPENWYPEDATVEVWTELAGGEAWMIESSLRENRIHSRTDTWADRSCKIFVLLGDAKRAREIIREITEAAPPE